MQQLLVLLLLPTSNQDLGEEIGTKLRYSTSVLTVVVLKTNLVLTMCCLSKLEDFVICIFSAREIKQGKSSGLINLSSLLVLDCNKIKSWNFVVSVIGLI